MNDSGEDLIKPIFKNGRFNNPWSTWEEPSAKKFIMWRLCNKSNTNLPSDPKVRLRQHIIGVK